jgi:hypothetical protein
MTLAVTVTAIAAAVIIPTSPAAASPGNPPFITNNSGQPVAYSEGWCNGDVFYGDVPTCGDISVIWAGTTSYPTDPDAIRFDANCITYWSVDVTIVLPFGGISQTRYPQDPVNRLHESSKWLRITNTISDIENYVIDHKVCSYPFNFTVSAVGQTQVQVGWEDIPGTRFWIFKNDAYLATTTDHVYTVGGLTPGQTYRFSVSIYYGLYPGPRTSNQTVGTAPPAPSQYWVSTFANAPGRSSPGGTQTGTLYAGYNYVYCKVWGPVVQSGGAYNHYWLKTDLDTGYPWQNQWVSAYYLTKWGNDEAKDDDGHVIRDC